MVNLEQVINDIRQSHEKGQPVLVGTIRFDRKIRKIK